MKNLAIVVFVMMFLTSFALAQNTATTTQTGDDNNATVTQTGKNLSTGSQTGDDNTATITQASLDNEVLFEQGGGIYEANPGDNNSLIVNQQGEGNYAKTREYKNNNISNMNQVGNYNYAKQWIWASDNTAVQSQTSGNQNYSEIAINGVDGHNQATIHQIGSSNIGSIGQGWSGNAHGYNEAIINQTGNNNLISVEDGLALPGYTVDLWGLGVHQYGSRNFSQIDQLGDDNTSWTYQFGDDNHATVDVSNSNNIGKIAQLGNLNDADIIQSSAFNTSYLTQDGNGNIIDTEQKTGTYNIIHLKQDGGSNGNILQDGADNTVMGLGVDPLATSLNGSTLDVDQVGTGNTLHLQQTNGASATVMQDGLTNTAVVIQN